LTGSVPGEAQVRASPALLESGPKRLVGRAPAALRSRIGGAPSEVAAATESRQGIRLRLSVAARLACAVRAVEEGAVDRIPPAAESSGPAREKKEARRQPRMPGPVPWLRPSLLARQWLPPAWSPDPSADATWTLPQLRLALMKVDWAPARRRQPILIATARRPPTLAQVSASKSFPAGMSYNPPACRSDRAGESTRPARPLRSVRAHGTGGGLSARASMSHLGRLRWAVAELPLVGWRWDRPSPMRRQSGRRDRPGPAARRASGERRR
jgi:hypothetical protein